MISNLVGWSSELIPRGFAFTHPEGANVATVHYAERVHPLRRLGALVEGILAATPGFEIRAIGEPERLLTLDGEHAAAITVLGTQRGATARRDLGFVFGDDVFSSISGLCLRPALDVELGRIVRDLVRSDVHAFGLRRRRFEYSPPQGWQPLGQRLAVQWFPPDYPANTTWLMVYPANPVTLIESAVTDAATIERALAYLEECGFLIEDKRPPEPLLAASGLRGTGQQVLAKRADGKSIHHEVAILRDQRYAYVVELWSQASARWPEHRAVLRTLVHGIRPVPASSRHEAALNAVSHWLD